LSVLSDSLQNIQDGTRKKHIIQDIIQQNDSESILNHKRDQIKRLLTNYSGLNGKLKQELKQLGFTVTEDGKHYKLTYFDDNRYTITMAKTPSDGRAGKNNVSEINKKMDPHCESMSLFCLTPGSNRCPVTVHMKTSVRIRSNPLFSTILCFYLFLLIVL